MHRLGAIGFLVLAVWVAASAPAVAQGPAAAPRPDPAAEEAAEQALLRMPDVDLADAARRGDLKTIALVLAGDPDALWREMSSSRGRSSPLAAAAEAGQVEALRMLLRAAGAGLNNDDLLWVIEPASEGRIGPVRTYVQAGGDVNLPGNSSITALHRAACAGRLEIVELLIRSGADVNLGPNNWTPLHGAAESGHRAVVQRLLDAGAKIDVARTWGWRPIHSALWSGHPDVARLLLERGSKMDLLVAIGLGRTDEALKLLETPLPEESAGPPEPPPAFWAARCGQLDLLKRLVRDKAALCRELPVKFHSLKGATLLHVAAGDGHADVVRWLIGQGAPVDRASGTISWFNDCTPLHFAAESGKIEAAKALLAAGARIEGAAHDTARPAKASRTPLLVAVRENQREMVEFLLDRGADIEAAPSPGITALSLAAEEGHLDLCKLLVKRGAKLAGKPGTITPLAAAVSSGPELLEFLIAQGADASGKAGEGRLALLLASWRNPACVEVLLRHGAKPDDPDILASALEAGEAKSVRLLLEAGARLDADDPAKMLRDAGALGDVALMKKLLASGTALRNPQQDEFSRHLLSRALEGAVANGHKDLVRFLIARGCRPDEQLDGEAALVLAAARGCKLVVLALLEAGAGPEATGLSRRTALVAAAEGGWPGTLRVLLRHVGPPPADDDGRSLLSRAATGDRSAVLDLLLDTELGKDPKALAVALHAAADHQQGETLRYLVRERGLDVNAAVRDGRTALHESINGQRARHEGPDVALARLLLDLGADPNRPDAKGETPLHGAIESDSFDLARLMLDKGAKTDLFAAAALGQKDRAAALVAEDPKRLGQSKGSVGGPLAWAAHGGHAEVAALLLDRGAAPEGNGADGGRVTGTPLYWAARAGHLDVVRLLLDRGADPNGRSSRESPTPLSGAVAYSRTVVVGELLRRGADPNAAIQDKWTPLHVAANVGQPHLARLLLEHGADPEAQNDRKQTLVDVACDPNVDWRYSPTGDRVLPRPGRAAVVQAVFDHYLSGGKLSPKDVLDKALRLAVRDGAPGLARRALDLGADVNRDGQHNGTPLWLAVWESQVRAHKDWQEEKKRRAGYVAVVELLLERGADPNLGLRDQSALALARDFFQDPEFTRLLTKPTAPAGP